MILEGIAIIAATGAVVGAFKKLVESTSESTYYDSSRMGGD